MDRRSALVTLVSPALTGLWKRPVADAPSMRITRLDTVFWESRDDAPFWPPRNWLRVHTDSSPGRDPGDVERIWTDPFRAFDCQVAGGTGGHGRERASPERRREQ